MPQETTNQNQLISYYLILAALAIYIINTAIHTSSFRISFFFNLILYVTVYISCALMTKNKKRWGTYLFIALTTYSLYHLLYYFSVLDRFPFFYTAFIIQLLLQLVAIIYGLKAIKANQQKLNFHE